MSGCSLLNFILPFLPCSCLCKQKTKENNESEIKPIASVSVQETPGNRNIDKDLVKVTKNVNLTKQYDKNGIHPSEEKTSIILKDNGIQNSETSIKGKTSVTVDLKNVSNEANAEKIISGICINLLIHSYFVFTYT